MKATSLNFRDWALANGRFGYPGEVLPMLPFSDAAGLVTAVGDGVTTVRPGDQVAIHFFPDWHAGAFTAAKTFRSLLRHMGSGAHFGKVVGRVGQHAG